ncbi:MAG: radical SAM protein, partial [Candidatus Gracilibacteria bacterium]|nr:radical SAM protein [Candidatus Gracilibacteria bacterium]
SESEFEQVKGGSLEKYLKFILELAHSFPGKIGTHVIVGFSETEEELVNLLRKLHSAGVVTSLFAFTPVRGTKLEDQKAPSLEKYRRVQVAFELVKQSRDSGLGTRNGEIIDFGYDKDDLYNLLKNSKVFEVNGCEGCSRPYYNERPGGVIYNWPRGLTEEEMREEIAKKESFC